VLCCGVSSWSCLILPVVVYESLTVCVCVWYWMEETTNQGRQNKPMTAPGLYSFSNVPPEFRRLLVREVKCDIVCYATQKDKRGGRKRGGVLRATLVLTQQAIDSKNRKRATIQSKAEDVTTRQDKTRQDKTGQDRTRQDKTRQDKTRRDKI
jgi:hypothetical protein